MIKVYKGYEIYPHDYNGMGMRYYAYSTHGGKLRADTLRGIKELITEELEA
jgi:hypothetical protein